MYSDNIVEKLAGKKGKKAVKLKNLTAKGPTKTKPIICASDLTKKK